MKMYKRGAIFTALSGSLTGSLNSPAIPVSNGDPYFANVVSLLSMDQSGQVSYIPDLIGTRVWTNSLGVFDTIQKKFGTSSISLPVSSAITASNANGDFDFFGDFTIELWYYYKGTAVTFSGLLDTGRQAVYLMFGESTQNISIYSAVDTSRSDFTGVPHNMVLNSWNFITCQRKGAVYSISVNGHTVGSWSAPSVVPLIADKSYNATIGNYSVGSAYSCGGNIDEVRITNGVARYSGDFTPPVAPFPN